MVVGRFAPSPSGLMHLGNARTALLAWLDARARGGRMVLRVEDLDRPRCRPAFADAARRDLAWLGLDWDAETAPQSRRDDAYAAAVDRLAAAGRVFECFCTRRELGAASAPHGATRRYPGTCRDLSAGERAARRASGRAPALRARMDAAPLTVVDRLHGELTGVADDVVLRRSDGLYAYQLAVVVDDASDGVTDVVRGDDLLPATPSQAALARLLGLPAPHYAHVPLVLGRDGARLAKRHGAVAVADLRERGVSAGELVGTLAAGLGLAPVGAALAPTDVVPAFRLETIPTAPTRLTGPAFAPA
jgi:glutamyl-tRNA synthetase